MEFQGRGDGKIDVTRTIKIVSIFDPTECEKKFVRIIYFNYRGTRSRLE